ncbi:cupin domain-containing protein [bacterium]|nr:cupin domain-containing protein [bacterium]
MDINKHITTMDRRKFQAAHNDTVYVQNCFPNLQLDEIRPDTFQYMPCWAIIDPGMTVEPHEHPIAEFYVFTAGEGNMRVGEETFLVKAGMAVNIPKDLVHSVINDPAAVTPLIWVSIGLKGETEGWQH